jgi:hypothetical protein
VGGEGASPIVAVGDDDPVQCGRCVHNTTVYVRGLYAEACEYDIGPREEEMTDEELGKWAEGDCPRFKERKEE